MLVYANHLSFKGADAEQAVLNAVGGWLKEQLGSGLHPDQLKQNGEFNGHRGDQRSWLRIHGCYDEEPRLCAWVLKHAALLHESSLARTMPIDRIILTCRCDTTLVDRGRSSD